MPNYNTTYDVAFQFRLEFFAANDTEADTVADALVAQIFSTNAFSVITKTQGAASGITLSGQAVSGKNYTYIYTMAIKVGVAPNYHSVFASSAQNALTALKSEAVRITGIQNLPVKLTYLQT